MPLSDQRTVLINSSSPKKLVASIAIITAASCSEAAPPSQEVMGLLDRCWDYVDTGDLPTRSLYWVNKMVFPTYRTRSTLNPTGIRIQITGSSDNARDCTISNWEAYWTAGQQEAVVELVVEAASGWLAARNDISSGLTITYDVSASDLTIHQVFLPHSLSGAYLELYSDPINGFFAVRVGRGDFELADDRKTLAQINPLSRPTSY